MTILIITLRILHIVAGILWAGGALIDFMFISPTAKATSPESQKFIDYLMVQKRFAKFMTITALTTIIAGALLYYRLGSVNWNWITTGSGIGFSIGALAGILAFVVGNRLIVPPAEKMSKLSLEIQATGGSATPEQDAQMTQWQQEMGRAEKLDFVLISIAILTMATARYWTF